MDKYIIFLYILTGILIIKKFKKKFIEKNTNVDNSIRDEIKRMYKINVSLIKELGDICQEILNPTNGTVTLPNGINLKILGNVETTNNVIATEYGIFGNTKIGSSHSSNRYAQISHKDMFGSYNYAILQNDTGATFINSKSGKNIEFRKDDSLTDAGIKISNIKANHTINISGNVNFTNNINSNGTITAGNNLIFNNELLGSGNKFRVVFDPLYCFIQTNKNNFKMTGYDEEIKKTLSVSSLETTQFDLSKVKKNVVVDKYIYVNDENASEDSRDDVEKANIYALTNLFFKGTNEIENTGATLKKSTYRRAAFGKKIYHTHEDSWVHT